VLLQANVLVKVLVILGVIRP